MQSQDCHEETVNNDEVHGKESVEEKPIERIFAELGDSSLQDAVDDIHVQILREDFFFKVGWDKTGCYFQLRAKRIRFSRLCKVFSSVLLFFPWVFWRVKAYFGF